MKILALTRRRQHRHAGDAKIWRPAPSFQTISPRFAE
jgi:hypothetical protein